ncbi:hypothetical protein [Croceicoccus gelatinilyticus]|uniref:hypothetical protein n=1 Tax=Croceicoccus gelatinilyticus TaxID=2835536 RepID=UPI001BCFD5E8|nr:hypothetical protein [Croceicoccus gelatinilyticus]MBS7671535.1 hypothetical protein [Croceicoccus gelatinilyticus]
MLGFGLIFAFDIGLMVAHIIAADTAKDAFAAYAVIFSIVAFIAPLTAENRRYLERIAEDGRTYAVFFVLICAGATGAVAAHVAIHDPALVVTAFILAFFSPFSRYLPKPIADRL